MLVYIADAIDYIFKAEPSLKILFKNRNRNVDLEENERNLIYLCIWDDIGG